MSQLQIGSGIVGIATAQSSGPSGTSAPQGREVRGKIIGTDPKPKNHPQGFYWVVKEDGTNNVVYIPGEPPKESSTSHKEGIYYCKGCGHRFYGAKTGTGEDLAADYLCQYCVEELDSKHD